MPEGAAPWPQKAQPAISRQHCVGALPANRL